MKTVSCIIPAYNEEKRIRDTLKVVVPLLGTHLFEIIVIDDCSKDNTKQIIREFPSVRLIEHTENGGKSKTVADGIAVATGEFIFLLDADLHHLSSQDIIDIIGPIVRDVADVTISYRKNAWPLFPFKKLDYLSGERIFRRSLVSDILPEMAALRSYGLEVFLNRLIIAHKERIVVVHWPTVENDFNQYKHGWFVGIGIMLNIWLDVLSTVSLYEMYAQNIRMQRLMVEG